MRNKLINQKRGFTLIEVLVVVALLGIISMALYPNIRNAQETRNLENSAREILTTLHTAKFQAVKEKLFHRVRFFTQDGRWMSVVERRTDAGSDTWEKVPKTVYKTVPSQFNVTVDLPSDTVTFSTMGVVVDFDSTMNSITLQSPKLHRQNQPDLRAVSVFAGGSVRYEKLQSGG
ncbi:MAG: GspH/FimT family pseudopilin [Candidatus Aminicenantaceae bacterium]